MSRVFVAQDRRLGRRVAVKVLSREVAAEIKTERFRLEIQLAAKLQHPHIVTLLESGEVGGILYYTMPYIEGESLRTRLDREGALPIPDGLRILRQVASAISYAHRNGVVHRDIKPDNVLLNDEFALVADFGVARALSESTTLSDQRLTGGGVALGSPAYMAPEQALADPDVDHRADIYAFGVLAYEVLTGAPPFRGKSAQAVLAAHVVQAPDPIESKREGIPPAVAALIMQCLEKKPADRPQNASDLLPVFDAAGTAPSGETAPTSASLPAAQRPKRTLWWAVAALALMITGAVTWPLITRDRGTSASGQFNSIAVLPLVNLSGSKADEYFSDGMTDELATTLAKLPGIKVASRTSAYAFKGKDASVEEIGKKLNVKAVIEGTVRRAGDRLRVSAQLTNVADGLALWSNTYERDSKDVFSVQDDIAKAIADALKLRLGNHSETLASDARGTDNLGAYDDFLRGRYFLNARGADNLRLAVAYFDSAVTHDPKFARAYAGRATAYALLPEYTDSPPPNASELTYESARSALQIDSTLAEAYTALGLAEIHDWKWHAADSAYRKALALDPEYPTAHQWYGEMLFHTGRLDSSVAQIRQAGALDPLAPINASALGYALTSAGKYDEAISVLKKGIEVAPNLGLHHAMLGAAYVLTNRLDSAIAEVQTSVKLDPELALRKGYLAHAYGLAGQKDKATAIIRQLEASQKKPGALGVAIAAAYLGIGEKDQALTALEAAVNAHDVSLVTTISLVPDKTWDPIRSDPRFDRILARMNLLEYAHPTRRN